MKKLIVIVVIALAIALGGIVSGLNKHTDVQLTSGDLQGSKYQVQGILTQPNPILPGDARFNPTHLPQIQ